jgi:DNA-binding HxlR family transcriptional regulator
MLGTTYEKQNCSAARALEVVGERWSLLILRDALFRGMTRFSEFERSLGLAPNVLAKRLEGFVASGLLEKSTDGGDHVDRYRPPRKATSFPRRSPSRTVPSMSAISTSFRSTRNGREFRSSDRMKSRTSSPDSRFPPR